jgi:hypothetical protein
MKVVNDIFVVANIDATLARTSFESVGVSRDQVQRRPGARNKRRPFWEIDELTREEGEMFAFADAIEQSSGRNSRTGTQCGARAAI